MTSHVSGHCWLLRRHIQWQDSWLKRTNPHYIWTHNSEDIPFNIYGTWNKSKLDNEDLQQELLTHLQGIRKYICAQDVSRYMNRNEVKKKYGMKKGITERTARNWLSKLGFRWTLEPSGQYVGGHEREDVVTYCQQIFLP